MSDHAKKSATVPVAVFGLAILPDFVLSIETGFKFGRIGELAAGAEGLGACFAALLSPPFRNPARKFTCARFAAALSLDILPEAVRFPSSFLRFFNCPAAKAAMLPPPVPGVGLGAV